MCPPAYEDGWACAKSRACRSADTYIKRVYPCASEFEVWVSEFTICNAQLILSARIYGGNWTSFKAGPALSLSPPSITETQTQSSARPSAEHDWFEPIRASFPMQTGNHKHRTLFEPFFFCFYYNCLSITHPDSKVNFPPNLCPYEIHFFFFTNKFSLIGIPVFNLFGKDHSRV